MDSLTRSFNANCKICQSHFCIHASRPSRPFTHRLDLSKCLSTRSTCKSSRPSRRSPRLGRSTRSNLLNMVIANATVKNIVNMRRKSSTEIIIKLALGIRRLPPFLEREGIFCIVSVDPRIIVVREYAGAIFNILFRFPMDSS